MRITYNAPVTLTYTFIAFFVTLLNSFLYAGTPPEAFYSTFTGSYFMVYPFNTPYMEVSNPLMYWRLFSHAIGHSNWQHFFGNFSYILLIGPILEEKYGPKIILVMCVATAFLTGLLNAMLFSNPLLGASGIVFMMILLASFTNMRAGTLPLTFLLIAFLYIGQEIYNITQEDSISQFAHVLGGICGGLFGYVLGIRANSPKSA